MLKIANEDGLLARGPHPIDIHVGKRIRMRRRRVGVSQGQLGAELGVTFQQVQKYEKGTNRVGASKLKQIADALGVTVGYFFKGLPQSTPMGGDRAEDVAEVAAA
jgi:transcriptional regulator with XRE-family HTH domain